MRNEYVIGVDRGVVFCAIRALLIRKFQQAKSKWIAKEIEIVNEAKNPPFMIEDRIDVGEDVRLKYRYLDLRRPIMQETIKLRHEITKTYPQLFGRA